MNCNSNTAALVASTTSSCNNGCEPKPINVICRKIIIPSGQNILAVEGDTNSSYREFWLPIETEQGYSLENATFSIVVNNSNNEQHKVEISDENKTIEGNYIKIKWILSVEDTLVPGNITISIRATSNNFKWETFSAQFVIQSSLSGVARASSTILLQEKTITPTTEEQVVTPDNGYGALSEVTVTAINAENVVAELDFSTVDTIEIEPADGYDYISKVTINKDANLISSNVRSGITIDGIEGTVDSAWDATQIRQCRYMFYGNDTMTTAPSFNTSNVTNMDYMFYGCASLQSVPEYITTNVTNMDYMFCDCTALETIPSLDTSNVTSFNSTFDGCTNLTSIPLIDTSSATSMSRMFYECYALAELPLLDMSNVLNVGLMFYNCVSLKELPQLNLSKVTFFSQFLSQCTKLETIPVLDISSARTVSNMFQGCVQLTDESLNNIMEMCIGTTNVSSTSKTLSHIGLLQSQATRCMSLSNYDAFVEAGWTTGY